MTLDYFLHHRLRAGLARLEGLTHLLQQELTHPDHTLEQLYRIHTLQLLLQEIHALKQFTEQYTQQPP